MPLTVSTLALRLDSSGMVRGATDAQNALRGVRGEAARASDDTNRLSASFSSTGRVSAILRGQMVALGAAIAAFAGLRTAIREIASFELELARLGAVTGATREQLAAFESQARTLAPAMRTTAQEIVQAQSEIAKSGLSVVQSIAATPDVVLLARAGFLSLSEAAGITVASLRQFGIAAEDTARVTDVLVAAANAAITDVRGLGEGLKFVGPVARSLGIDFETTAAAIATLSNAGLDASQTGTGLRGVILDLIAPTEVAADTFRSLGISLEEINPERVGLIGALERLQQAELGATEAARLFGALHVSAALNLISGTRELRRIEAALRSSTGAVERQADQVNDTLNGSWRQFVAVLKEAQIALGESGLGALLRTTADLLTQTTVALFNLNVEGVEVSATAQTMATALQALVVVSTALVAVRLVVWLRDVALAIAAFSLANPFAAAFVGATALVGLLLEMERRTRSVREEQERLKQNALELQRAGFGGADFREQAAKGFVNESLIANLERDLSTQIFALKDIIAGNIAAVNSLAEDLPGTLSFSAQEISDFTQNLLTVEEILERLKEKGEDPGLLSVFGPEVLLNDIEALELLQLALQRVQAQLVKNAATTRAAARQEAIDAAVKGATDELERREKIEEIAKRFIEDVKLANLLQFTKNDALRNEIALRFQLQRLLDQQKAKGGETPALNPEQRRDLEDALKFQFEEIQKGQLGAFARDVDFLAASLTDSAEATKKFNDALGEMLFALEGALAQGLEDLIFSSESTKETLRRTAEEISRAAFRELAAQPIADAIAQFIRTLIQRILAAAGASVSTTVNARGNVFSSGEVIPFQSGGIIDRPTFFPLRRGIGLAGEASVEGIFPLARDAQGRLGVRAQDSQSAVRPMVINFNVYARDAQSFRASRNMIARDLERLAARAV